MTVSLDSMSICSGFHSSVLTHFICLNLVRRQGVRNKGLNFMIKKKSSCAYTAVVVLYVQSTSLQAYTSCKGND